MSEMELRELGVWIAEHVMGYRWVMHARPVGPFVGRRWLVSPEIYPELIQQKLWVDADMSLQVLEPSHHDTACPDYTADPAAAMGVLKKCHENTWNVFSRKTSDGLWIVGYIGGDKLELALFAEAKTLELAICLFAKKLFSK